MTEKFKTAICIISIIILTTISAICGSYAVINNFASRAVIYYDAFSPNGIIEIQRQIDEWKTSYEGLS